MNNANDRRPGVPSDLRGITFYYILILVVTCLAAAGLSSLLGGCAHDPLCYHHPHGLTLVRFDWSAAEREEQEGTSGGEGKSNTAGTGDSGESALTVGEIAETRALFFPVGGGVPSAEDFAGRRGGEVRLSPGEYAVAGFNGATSSTRWREDSLAGTVAYTRSATLTEDIPGLADPSTGSGETLVLPPDRLWVGRVDRVRVTGEDTTVITLVPRRVTYLVRWTVEDIEGVERVTLCRATLSGVAGMWCLVDTLPGAGAVSLPLVGVTDTTGGGRAAGTVETFGCRREDDCRHVLTLYLWTASGNLKASFDVTRQFHELLPGREIHLRVTGFVKIPGDDSTETGGGFVADVENWKENDQELIL